MEKQYLSEVQRWLEELGQVSGEPGDIRSTLLYITDIAKRIFEADICIAFAFHLIPDQYIDLHSVEFSGLMFNDTLPHSNFSIDELTSQVLQQNLVLIEDCTDERNYQPLWIAEEQICSLAAIALKTRYRKRPLAVLYLNFRRKHQFKEQEITFLRIFATQAAVLLQEAWSFNSYREITALGQEINHELSTYDALFQKVSVQLKHIVDVSATFALAIYHQQTDHLEMQLSGTEVHKQRPGQQKALEAACRFVVVTKQSLFCQHISQDAGLLAKVSDHTRSLLKESLIVVPLILRDNSLGAILLQHPQAMAYNQGDLFLIELLANHVALAFHNIRLFKNLQQLNETGRFLNQQSQPEETLQAVAEKIAEATCADFVILFPYDPASQQFFMPARQTGNLHMKASLRLISLLNEQSIVRQMLNRSETLFAKKSIQLYTEIYGENHTPTLTFEQQERMSSTAAISLRLNDETVGVLFIYFHREQRFDAAQKLLISGLAQYAAVAVKNASIIYDIMQRHTSELDIVHNIDLALNRGLELESILELILHLANKQVKAEQAMIVLYDEEERELWTAAAIGSHAQERRELVLPLTKNSLNYWVWQNKKALRVHNVQKDQPWCKLYYPATPETLSELDVPLLDNNEVVGIFNFESSKERAFSEEHEVFVKTLAGQAVLALKKVNDYEREKRLTAERQLLSDISRQMTSQLNVSRIFDLILEKALEITQSSHGLLLRYDQNVQGLRVKRAIGMMGSINEQILTPTTGIIGQVARTRRIVNIDPTQDSWYDDDTRKMPGTRSLLGVPMLADQDLCGILIVASHQEHNFKERDERLLLALADLTLVALQNAERYELAQQEAQRLALLNETGLRLATINDCTELKRAYAIILHAAQAQHHECHGVIRRFNEQAETLEVVYATSQAHVAIDPLELCRRLGKPASGERKSQPLVIPDLATVNGLTLTAFLQTPVESGFTSTCSDTPGSEKPLICSLVIVPITFNEHYYGTLELSHSSIGYFDPHRVEFLSTLVHQLASTIDRLQTVQERQEFEKRALVAETMSMIGQSAYELTHRLGNDLGMLPTFLNQVIHELQKQLDDSKLVGKLDEVRQSIEKVLSLSRKLKKDFAADDDRQGGGVMVVSPKVLLEEAYLSLHFDQERITAVIECDPDTSAVSVMPQLVIDILSNLFVNAVEAILQSDLRGTITLSATNSGRFVAFRVADTGPGIKPHLLTKIFDLFFSTKQSSGFGLWSARQNALRNHGLLDVESIPGKGTTFILLLPKAPK